MLARTNSLKTNADFTRVKTQGKKVPSDSFTLVFIKSEKEGPSRFGFVISTKISKHASLRNRAKRAMSEGVRRSTYFVKEGYDCVFLAKPIIVKKYTNDLMKEVEETLIKAGLVKQS